MSETNHEFNTTLGVFKQASTTPADKGSPGTSGIYLPFDKALGEDYDTHATFVPYIIEGTTHPIYITNKVSSEIVSTLSVSMYWLVIDLDRNPHEPWSGLSVGREVLARIIENLGCPGYTTKNGLRLLIPLEKPTNIAYWRRQCERFNTKIISLLGEIFNTEPNGWNVRVGENDVLQLDISNCEWDRKYLLPKVFKQGSGKTHAYAKVIIPEVILPIARVTEDDNHVSSLEKMLVIEERPEDPVMNSEEKRKMMEAIRGSFKSRESVVEAIIAGKRFFDKGQRNKATYSAVRIISESLGNLHGKPVRPSTVYSLIMTSVEDTQGATPVQDALLETWKMCTDVYIDLAKKHIKTVEAKNRLKNITVNDKAMPLIVNTGKSYFILDTQKMRYLPPTSNDAMLPGLFEKYAGQGDLKVRSDRGGFIASNLILSEYAVLASEVIFVLGGSEEYYVPENFKFYMSSCKPLDVPSVYHEDVAKWLSLLAGKNEADKEALLDWLATFFMFKDVNTAIYLRGRDSCGKSMLPIALSSIFGSSPVPFTEAISNFNDALTKSPVVWLNEGISMNPDAFTFEFRKVTGDLEHKVQGKYLPTASVRGAFRVVVTANHNKALPLSESGSEDDGIAVIKRIRYFEVDPEAAIYLEENGGKQGISRDWVRYEDTDKPGKICEHVMWLANNRKPVLGSRFLVPYRHTPYHDKMSVSTKRIDIINILVKIPFFGAFENYASVDVKEKILWVNISELQSKWLMLSGTGKTPELHNIMDMIETLARVDSKRMSLNGVQKRVQGFKALELYKKALQLDADHAEMFGELFGLQL